jgi:hypothetical protein
MGNTNYAVSKIERLSCRLVDQKRWIRYMEIDRYKDVVDRLAAEKKDSRFTNKGPNHARVVVAAMLNNATSNVKLFTGTLPSSFYTSEEVLEAFKTFLAKGSVTVLAADTCDDVALQKLKEVAAGKPITFFSLTEKIEKMPPHFMVADGQAFTLEMDDAKAEAVVNFNEPKIAATLSGIFDSLVEKHSTQI